MLRNNNTFVTAWREIWDSFIVYEEIIDSSIGVVDMREGVLSSCRIQEPPKIREAKIVEERFDVTGRFAESSRFRGEAV